MWAALAVEEGIIPLGFHDAPHGLCEARERDGLMAHLMSMGRGKRAASQDVREVFDFYDAGSETLWVSFADGHLYWAFSGGPVEMRQTDDRARPSRIRPTRDGWHRHDLKGAPLSVSNLSSALTQTGNYRRTICKVGQEDYLLRKIRGETNPLHDRADRLQADMIALASEMIRELHWSDFETLTDLIFVRGGWRRTSLLGKTMPDVDLILDQPLSGERAWVQVKSRTNQAELDDYVSRFERDGSFDRFFYVCHSAPEGLAVKDAQAHHHLLVGDELARLTISVGLFDWAVEQTR